MPLWCKVRDLGPLSLVRMRRGERDGPYAVLFTKTGQLVKGSMDYFDASAWLLDSGMTNNDERESVLQESELWAANTEPPLTLPNPVSGKPAEGKRAAGQSRKK